jgi:hypothetical protein
MQVYCIAGNLLHSGNRKMEEQNVAMKRGTQNIRAHAGTMGTRRQGLFSFQK